MMKNGILIAFFLIILMSCNNSEKEKNELEKDTPQEEEVMNDVREPSCIYKKSDKVVSATYPFNKADEIKIYSYPIREDAYTNDSLIVNGRFKEKKREDKIVLNQSQIDTLFSILYNYQAKKRENDSAAADCYNPRHAIVFYKNGKAISFLEVCLECGGTRQSKDVNLGDFCNEKMCMLQKFFRKVGVKHGIIDEVCQ